MGNIIPVDLRRTTRAIAVNYGDKGAVVISVSDEGVRVGPEGLTPDELRHALCIAINYTFECTDFEDPS